jgi:hypothetical protein
MPHLPHDPIRLSVYQVTTETGIAGAKIKEGLKSNGIRAGSDGKYSFRDMMTAMTSRTGLETKARAAKLQRIIDEAEIARIERDTTRGKLVPLQVLKDYAAEVAAQTVTFIRHSELSETKKRQLLEQLRGIEFEFTKIVPFENGERK